ncbi:MAG: winged helix-turn-helix transcriptional regulator, partial [Kiritimatiellae bacterium]|nr:winged helix-turn-helix transcriptional regulator [Kiritimatiellia bacterium]
ELALLRLFAAHPGRVLGRDFLLNAAWGVGYYGTTRTLDQHVAVLRRKLGSAAAALETVRGSGYRLRAPD